MKTRVELGRVRLDAQIKFRLGGIMEMMRQDASYKT